MLQCQKGAARQGVSGGGASLDSGSLLTNRREADGSRSPRWGKFFDMEPAVFSGRSTFRTKKKGRPPVTV